MRSKIIILLALLMVLGIGSVFAEVPSLFEINLLNYYSVEDLSESQFTNYTPGVRFAGFITKWFGLSADVILEAPFAEASPTNYHLLLATDAVVRAPLGFFEMYVAAGPAYGFTISEDNFVVDNKVKLNARVGFDFNITPLLSVGVEGAYILGDLASLVSGASEFEPKAETFVGIGLKLKL